MNVGSLSPYDMAQWVEYMTSSEDASLANERRENGRDKPWQLKYLGIGNETWGCGGNMSGEYAAVDQCALFHLRQRARVHGHGQGRQRRQRQ